LKSWNHLENQIDFIKYILQYILIGILFELVYIDMYFFVLKNNVRVKNRIDSASKLTDHQGKDLLIEQEHGCYLGSLGKDLMSSGCFGSTSVTRANRDVFLGLARKRDDCNNTMDDRLLLLMPPPSSSSSTSGCCGGTLMVEKVEQIQPVVVRVNTRVIFIVS
jgi:hypothetical protein